MKNRRLYWLMALAACLVLIGGLAASAQPGLAAEPTPQPAVEGVYRGVSTAERFSVSPRVSDLPLYTGSPAVLSANRDLPTGLEGPLGPQDVDPLVQSMAGPFAMPAPSVSFDSVSNIAGVTPPDPVGDVGPDHYVAMSNLYFAVYSKTGTLLAGPFANNTLWAGFGGACQTENSGDPIVIYDQFADRWMLTQFTSAGPTYYNCVALSTTGDPTGTYYRWAFSTGGNFPDYPKYGVWSDTYFISTREFAGASYAGVGAYALNRADMISGDPTPQVISFLAPSGYNTGDGLLPADIDGSALPPAGSPGYFLGSMDNGGPYGAPQDALTLWKFTVNWVTPGSSSFVLANTIPVAAFDSVFPCTPTSRACIPQPGTSNKLDILSYRQRPLWRLAYRNYGTHESLVTNQAVEATTGMAGIRWYELRSPNSSPVVYQQGTYAPGATDGIHRWMGSIAMDAVGNMALGYSASDGTSTYPSSWYTGRLAADTLGTMPQGEGSIINGTGSQTGSNRWGDYTSMNVDPVDDCTFWYVNQYIPTTSSNGWRLRVGAFKFPNCSAQTQADLSIEKTGPALVEPGGFMTYTLSVVNNGPDVITPTLAVPSYAGAISIPLSGAATPYPAIIDTYALTGTLLDVNVILSDLGHTYPDDLDVLLYSPGGEMVLLMSDAGGGEDLTSTTLTFDDEAVDYLPDSAQIAEGSYLPTDYGADDTFPAPVPAGPYPTDLSVFEGGDWIGNWNLYVVDDTGGDAGSIANGWSLELLIAPDTVNISDTLPGGMGLNSYAGAGWTCSAAGSLVQCTSPIMPLGPAPDLVLTAFAPLTTGYITNTAQVTTTAGDDVPDNDFSSVMTLVDTPPGANGDVYTVTEDVPLVVADPGVLINDADVDLDPLTVSLGSPPANGTVTLNPTGGFVYTPTQNYYGGDFFTYILSDGYLTQTAQVDLIIEPVWEAPSVAAGDDQGVNEGDLVYFSGSFYDPGLKRPLAGETFRWDFGDGAWVTGSLTASHIYEDNGLYTATLTITDTDGLAGSDWLAVQVANLDPTLDGLPDVAALTAEPVTINGVYSDPGALDSHEVVIEWAPGITETISLDAGDSSFSATHIYLVEGVYQVVVTITDDDGGSATRSFEATILPRRVFLPTLLR